MVRDNGDKKDSDRNCEKLLISICGCSSVHARLNSFCVAGTIMFRLLLFAITISHASGWTCPSPYTPASQDQGCLVKLDGNPTSLTAFKLYTLTWQPEVFKASQVWIRLVSRPINGVDGNCFFG